jgi:hypothetical protein
MTAPTVYLWAVRITTEPIPGLVGIAQDVRILGTTEEARAVALSYRTPGEETHIAMEAIDQDPT